MREFNRPPMARLLTHLTVFSVPEEGVIKYSDPHE